MTKIFKYLVVALALISLGGLSASAQTTTSKELRPRVNAAKRFTASSTERNRLAERTASSTTASLDRLIARSDKEIANRIEKLNALNNRLQAMRLISASDKASLASVIQTEISNLTALKTKIDADTDLATLRSDNQSIVKDFRVYALVMPQLGILAASDRLNTIAADLEAVGLKIQARLSAAETAGKNVSSLNKILADLNSKVADAKTEAQSAVSAVAGLSPDQGDQAKASANKKALETARTALKAGQQDIKTARKNATTLVKGLKDLGVAAIGSGTSSNATSTH